MTSTRGLRPSRPSRVARPAGPTSRGTWVRRLLGALVLCLALGSLFWYVGMLPYSYPASLLIALTFGTVSFFVIWTMQEQGGDLETAEWFTRRREEATTPASLDSRMLRLRRDLRDALERDDRRDEVYALVRDLAAERLSAHHGIDLTTEPEAAARVMPPPLRSYLDRPPRGTERRSRRALERAIEGVEAL